MYCSKCGTPNEDTIKFCPNCGNALAGPLPQSGMTPPPVAAPTPGQAYAPAPPAPKKPYRAERSLGLTGTIIASVLLISLIAISISELTGNYYADFDYIEGMMTLTAVLGIATVVLGYIGIVQINRGNLKGGGTMLIISGGLGFISMFLSPVSAVLTLFYWPLILSGGITALCRRSHLMKTGQYTD